jgi:beta-N-acetylhexosaminidase
MEMGAVLKTLPIEEAAVAHIRAGGDLSLICRTEDLIVRAYEAVVKEAEKDRRFALQLDKAAKRVTQLKKNHLASIVWKFPPAPTPKKLDRLKRQLWDLSERVRLKHIVMNQEQE